MSSQPHLDDEKSAASVHNDSADLEDAAREGLEDQDVAIAIVGDHRHAIDPATEARVLRKIDMFLVPAMSIGYGLTYYDKVRLFCNATING
jgi:hypothetical protein